MRLTDKPQQRACIMAPHVTSGMPTRQVESASEQTGTLVIGAAIFGLAAVLFVAGVLYDPMQTTAIKSGGFF